MRCPHAIASHQLSVYEAFNTTCNNLRAHVRLGATLLAIKRNKPDSINPKTLAIIALY